MRLLLSRRSVPYTLLVLAAIIAALVYALPPEATLGSTIRIVLLHGALARAGMVSFAAAGLLGAVLLFKPDDHLGSWTLAMQRTSLAVWLAAAATSAIATYLSWGVWIAWGEPRTQGTVKILILALVLVGLVAWIGRHRFAGLANLVLAAFAWIVVLGATSVQHPEDPVGSSPSDFYRTIFLVLVVTLIITALQFARWIRRPVDPAFENV